MGKICVEDICDREGMPCVVMPEDEPLENVIKKFAENPVCGGVFLLDSKQRFAGILTRTSLLRWVIARLGGHRGKHVHLSAVFSSVFSSRARDLARGDWRTMGVKTSDDVETAFQQMVDYDVNYVPVLDKEGHIEGSLRLSQVLLKALEAGNNSLGNRPKVSF